METRADFMDGRERNETDLTPTPFFDPDSRLLSTPNQLHSTEISVTMNDATRAEIKKDPNSIKRKDKMAFNNRFEREKKGKVREGVFIKVHKNLICILPHINFFKTLHRVQINQIL